MKNSTHLEIFSGRRKGTLLLNTGRRIGIFFLFTMLLLVITSNDVYSVCFGCGGQIGGNQPCYTPWQVISPLANYGTPSNPWWEKTVYIGNCMIRQITCDASGNELSHTDHAGGCTCGGPMQAYNPDNYPLTAFSNTVNGNQFEISTTIDLVNLEVRQLTANGSIVYSHPGSVPANQTVGIPMSVFQTGQDYIIIGYDLLNNTSTYLPVRKGAANMENLQFFCSWGIPETADFQRKCVTYVSTGSVMIFFQHLDKSGTIMSAVLSPRFIPTLTQWGLIILGIGLFGLGAGYMLRRRFAHIKA